MKRDWITLLVLVAGIGFLARAADESPPPAAAPAAEAVPPPSAPAKRSAADLEKLVETIAIYPDPLIASIVPASVYPLEIVQAARFVADTNNLAKLDEQPWDDNVKAVARVPEALKKMNDNLPWTIQLGEAFLAQDKDVMDAIQSLRMKAHQAGTLRTTEQQVVVVTNTVVETVVEQQPVIVTNTIVQIVPTNPEIVYVPVYVPSTVYYPPPAYVYDPYAPVVTFGAGIAVGIILANGCDWHHGGCYYGGYYGGKYKHTTKIKVEGDVNIGSGNRPTQQGDRGSAGQKWKANQSRLNSSGARGTAPATQEARGWGSGTSAADKRPAASTGAVGNRPSTGAVGAKPSTGTVGTRPSTTPSTGAARPSSPSTSYNRPATTPSTTRPSAPSSAVNRPAAPSSAARPSQTASTPRPAPSPTVSRPSAPAPARSSSAFAPSGGGASARSASSRGAASRGGGAARGGGGRR